MTEETPLPSHYDAAGAQERYYDAWEKQGYFTADPKREGPAFSMVMPPPNVTGSLHMGHALNNTLPDILARYKRMDGYNVAWIPGADHASIAVHWVIERQLRAEKTDRHALGREAFLARAWQFKEDTQRTITQQQRRLGVSCDWTRWRFTMDEGLSEAVQDVFVRLFEDGLIYRAERLVNWDPVSHTSVSDLEVVYEENVARELYSFAYPLSDGQGELVAATTRPETMLGDTAVAVHPDDVRYKHLIGKMLRHPLVDREIPVVADAILVDPAFGTGVVKITPAHDFNDFEVGKRHKLPMINILNKDGTLNAVCGAFAGMSTDAARTAIKERLAELGLDRGSEPHKMNIGRSERSGAILEPMLSTQWYVRTRPLAAPSVAAIEHGAAKFVPSQWENTYYSWLRNVQDWCISRQLWWGHRIPAWHCQSCEHITVSRETPEVCGGCGKDTIKQDDDILDTWFSSALWPFSTLGWPSKTEDLRRYYPTATLITSFDIIFFWVARMMMFGQYFMGEVPFKDIYLHALIRDASGQKMSKTKGNVVDPLQMVDQYGCDAFRFTLTAMAGHGRDLRWDEQRAAGYQKFCNKVWQAFRFTMTNVADFDAKVPHCEPGSVYDRWIITRLHHATARVRENLDQYRFSDAAAALYSFIWDEFCDWYLEIAKTVLYQDGATAAGKRSTQATLLQVFSGISRLMHPMMPFLSEEIWQHLPQTDGSVMLQPYPKPEDYLDDADAAAEAGFIAEVVKAVRRMRSEYSVAPKDRITFTVHATATQQGYLQKHVAVVATLAKADATPWPGQAPKQAATDVVAGAEVFVPLAGLIDFAAEKSRLEKEIAKLDKEGERLGKQLGNAAFVERAPEEVVAEKRALLAATQSQKASLDAALQRLSV